MTDHLSILSTLAARTVEDARHREIVSGWLKEAGFAVLDVDTVELIDGECCTTAWHPDTGIYGDIRLSWSNCIASAMHLRHKKHGPIVVGPTPLAALRGLATSGLVPGALLAP